MSHALRLVQLRLAFWSVGQFSLYLRESSPDLRQPKLQCAGPLLGPLLQHVVLAEIQYLSQYALPLCRGVRGELVGAPLQEKGGVDEGLVLHVQRLSDGSLGLADGVARQRTKLPIVQDLKLQVRAALGTVLLSLAHYSEVVVREEKLELHFHTRCSQVDQIVVSVGARLSPEGPGHGVDDGRLAVAVVAGETGQVDAREIQRRDLVTVTHEVSYTQLERYHGEGSSLRS